MDIIFIVSIIILLCVLFFVIKKLNKLKEEQKLGIEELWLLKKEKYEQEIIELDLRKGELQEHYNKEKRQFEEEKQRLTREINEKQNFNNSLLKIREDELDRLIEEKRKEKEKTLDARLKLEEERKTLLLNNQFIQFTAEQDKEKERILKELDKVKAEFDEFRIQREAINQAIALENEEEEEKDRHRILLSQQDKEDIQYLLSIEEKINNKQLLRKLIWSEYLQKPFNDMLKRLFMGTPPKNVIYCIENVINHKKYIGKTTAEVSKRWTEHIKTSLEIGTIKSQNIHKALYGHWDEFIFSVISETEKEKVSAEEKYYISLFESDVYGYNMKGGG